MQRSSGLTAASKVPGKVLAPSVALPSRSAQGRRLVCRAQAVRQPQLASPGAGLRLGQANRRHCRTLTAVSNNDGMEVRGAAGGRGGSPLHG